MSDESRTLNEHAIAELRHDLRTPLNHIIGYGEMLMEDAEDRGDEGLVAALRSLNSSARDLVAFIQDTLSPARNQISERELGELRGGLRQPVQNIIASVDRLLESGDPAAVKDLATIRSAAEGLLGLACGTGGFAAADPAKAAPAAEPRRAHNCLDRGGALLVVDDNASNRELLQRRLEREGHSVVQAGDGRKALEIVKAGGIELLLLDIMMPEMDGYQVLQALKQDPALRDIPVIMISALDEIQSVVRCIEMGAEDYLPKPFDPVLLRARVGSSLEKKRLRDEERKTTAELARMLEKLKLTQEQLILQERLASLGAVTAGIAHEIKNPLNFVTNFAEVAQDLTKEIREELDPDEIAKIADLLGSLDQSVLKIREHGNRADSIVRAMLLHSRGESAAKQKTDINALLASDVNLAYHGLRAKDSTFNCAFQNDLDPAMEEVNVVPQHLSRVFLNIVSNACYAVHQKSKAADSAYRPLVCVSTRNRGLEVEIRIRDNGTGIPREVASRIFDPFFTTKPAGVGTGLGLSLSYDIVVKEHNGRLKVESQEGEFSEFIIEIPKNDEK